MSLLSFLFFAGAGCSSSADSPDFRRVSTDTAILETGGIDSVPSSGDDTSVEETGRDTAETGGGAFTLPEGIDTVILITDDTVRWEMLDEETMPGLVGRMAEGGIVAPNFWNTGHWTRGTMPSVISGLYGTSMGSDPYIQDHDPDIPDSVTTVAEIFRDAGWSTWLDNANNIWGSHMNGLQGYGQVYEPASGFYPSEGYKSAADQFERALDYLWSTSGKKFLHVHTLDAHDPYHQLDSSCKGEVDTLDAECPIDVETADFNAFNTDGYTQDEIDACRAAVEAAHRCTGTFLDNSFEAFMEEADASGLLEHALVVKTADHGEYWGESFPAVTTAWNHHVLMYAEVSRGWFWAWWKGAASFQVTQTTSQVDVVPTILALAGVDSSAYRFDGSSMLALPPDRYVLQFGCDPSQAYHGAISADGETHVILNAYYDASGGASRSSSRDDWQMYDPSADSREQNPLDAQGAPSDLVSAITAQQEATQPTFCE